MFGWISLKDVCIFFFPAQNHPFLISPPSLAACRGMLYCGSGDRQKFITNGWPAWADCIATACARRQLSPAPRCAHGARVILSYAFTKKKLYCSHLAKLHKESEANKSKGFWGNPVPFLPQKESLDIYDAAQSAVGTRAHLIILK